MDPVYDPAAWLDREYDVRASVPDSSRYHARRRGWSESLRERVSPIADLRYGAAARNTLDLFLPGEGESWPLVIYFHGGYWRANAKEDSAFVVRPLAAAGIACAVVEYPLLPGTSMSELVRDVRLSAAWLYGNAGRFGYDANRLFVAGHSSGAHLAGMILAPGWHRSLGLLPSAVRGACLISGLFDLEPLRHTAVNEWAGLNAASAAQHSPVRRLPRAPTRMLIAYGGQDTDEFRRQSKLYAAACQVAGLATRLIELEGRNHYETPEELHWADSQLTSTFVQMITEEDWP